MTARMGRTRARLAVMLVAAALPAGCAGSFQPTRLSRLHAGMALSEVAATLGPPDFMINAPRPQGGPAEVWQYRAGKGAHAASYCVEFQQGLLNSWHASASPVGQGCAPVDAPQ